jgi:peptidoglycan/LPS O-acetylase OafA/YrhL
VPVTGDATADAPARAEGTEGPTGARPGRIAHVPALDGLRGLAVVAVLLFHAGHLRGGWLGVDLFFVLSGYLITSLLMAERRASGGVDLVAFWGRRARRLLPALVVVLVAVAVYAKLELAPIDLGRVRSDGLATLGFVANWHDVVSGRTYWDRTLAPSLLGHTWSLAVEEQLYLVWPVALSVGLAWRHRRAGRSAGGPRREAGAVARVALVVAVASGALAVGLHLAGASNERIYLGTDTRAAAVALGAFVAGWRRRRRIDDRVAARLEAAGAVAAVALAGLWAWLDGSWDLTYRGGLLAASVLAAVVVAAAADPRSRRLAAPLSLPPLRYLGRISYGLYLWHWPVYAALDQRRTGLDDPALLAVRLGASVALAAVSFHLIERPIREQRPAGRWAGRAGLAAAVGAAALVVIALLAATLDAVSLPTGDLASGVVRPRHPLADAPEVVVLGDSVAASLAAPAIARPAAFGANVVRSTVLGCQAVWDGVHRVRGLEGDVSVPGPCPSGIAGLVARERPDAVVVLYGGWTDAEIELDGTWRTACDPPYRARLRQRLDQVLDDAAVSGATVVAVRAARSTNTYRRDRSWADTACANQVLDASAAAHGDPVVDLDAWLCPNGTCREQAGGMFLRSDGVHFQGPGGVVASHWLLERVAEQAGFDLATGGMEAAGRTDEAVARACRGFLLLTRLSDAVATQGLRGPNVRRDLDAALDAFAPASIEDLPDAFRADVSDLGGDTVRHGLEHLVDLAQAGKVPTPADLDPAAGAAVDRGMARLRQEC